MTRRDRPQPEQQAAVTVRLAELVDRYRRELAGVAEIVVGFAVEIGGTTVDLVPEQAGSVRVNWIDFGDDGDLQVQVESQGGGGIFEGLGRDLRGVAYVEMFVDAVVDGRVRELVGPGRSRLEILEPDGSVTHDTAYSGFWPLLPLPGWRRTATVIDYLPYRRC